MDSLSFRPQCFLVLGFLQSTLVHTNLAITIIHELLDLFQLLNFITKVFFLCGQLIISFQSRVMNFATGSEIQLLTNRVMEKIIGTEPKQEAFAHMAVSKLHCICILDTFPRGK